MARQLENGGVREQLKYLQREGEVINFEQNYCNDSSKLSSVLRDSFELHSVLQFPAASLPSYLLLTETFIENTKWTNNC